MSPDQQVMLPNGQQVSVAQFQQMQQMMMMQQMGGMEGGMPGSMMMQPGFSQPSPKVRAHSCCSPPQPLAPTTSNGPPPSKPPAHLFHRFRPQDMLELPAPPCIMGQCCTAGIVGITLFAVTGLYLKLNGTTDSVFPMFLGSLGIFAVSVPSPGLPSPRSHPKKISTHTRGPYLSPLTPLAPKVIMCFGSSKHVCVPTNQAPLVAGAVICGVAGYQAYLNTIGSETTSFIGTGVFAAAFATMVVSVYRFKDWWRELMFESAMKAQDVQKQATEMHNLNCKVKAVPFCTKIGDTADSCGLGRLNAARMCFGLMALAFGYTFYILWTTRDFVPPEEAGLEVN